MSSNGKVDRAWAEAMGMTIEDYRARFKPWAVRAHVHHDPPVGQRIVKSKPSKSKRAQVIERDGLRCRYCGNQVIMSGTGRFTLTIDHVVPLSRGGNNALSNLVVACLGCNQEKAHQLAEEWQTPLPTAFVELPESLPSDVCPDCTDGVWVDKDDGRSCPTCEGLGYITVARAMWLLLASRQRARRLEDALSRSAGECRELRRLIEDADGVLVTRRNLAEIVKRQSATIQEMSDVIGRLKRPSMARAGHHVLCLAVNADTSLTPRPTMTCYLPLHHEGAHQWS